MKTLILAAATVVASIPLHAQELSPVDRETLLDRLEKIQDTADSTADSRFQKAIAAYQAAMTSNDAAIDFYLKCEEKVNFIDLKKDGSDFRNWKRRHSDKFSDKHFRTALRQQLRWLILSLEAASNETDLDILAPKASDAVDSILSQAEDLHRYRNVLSAKVTGTVFAKAYDLNTVKVKDWPLSPIPIKTVYDQVILPPLRSPDTTQSLRTAWTKRITQELQLLDQWSGNPDDKRRAGEHSPQFEKFTQDSLPKLQWEAEVDIFKAGDQRGAALRMLAHIEKHIAHESAPKWADDFANLLQPDIGLEEDIKHAP